MTTLELIRADRSRLVAELVAANGEVRGSTVKCPFHEDQNASGGIHEHNGAWLYTCQRCTWNGQKNSGDVVAVRMAAEGIRFQEAKKRLGVEDAGPSVTPPTHRNGALPQPPISRKPTTPPPPPPTPTADRSGQAGSAHARLTSNPDLLAKLYNTRGVNQETVERFQVGYLEQDGRSWWVFPIKDGDQVTALKYHAADGKSPKSLWTKGADREQLFPAYLKPDGPVWLCPGELKALAVASAGLSAIGVTSGEGNQQRPADLPASTYTLLQGREVAVVADDDPTGERWGKHVIKQLGDNGINARLVDLGFNTSAGINDITDFIVERVTDGKDSQAIAATLQEAYRRSDKWFGVRVSDRWRSLETWKRVEHVSTGLRTLDELLGGEGLRCGGITIIAGKPKKGKSQLAAAIAVGAAQQGAPVGFFSLELTGADMAQLVAAQLSGVPRNAISRGTISGDYEQRFREASSKFANLPLDILDYCLWPDGLDRHQFVRLVDDGVRLFGWKLVVIDYGSLLEAAGEDGDRYSTEVADSKVLRQSAVRHNLALVVVNTLRKGSHKRKDEELELDDVAGAARQVYDATSVLLVNKEHTDQRDCGVIYVRPLALRYAYQRGDEVLSLRWRPRWGAIEDLTPGERESMTQGDADHA